MKKPRRLPKFPIFVQDWFSSMRVRAMTLEERGAFLELLLLQWQEGGLPESPEMLLRIAGLKGSPADHQLVVEAFPVSEDGQRRNKKCAEVRAEADSYCEDQAKKSAKGVEARMTRRLPVDDPLVDPGVTPLTLTPTLTLTLNVDSNGDRGSAEGGLTPPAPTAPPLATGEEASRRKTGTRKPKPEWRGSLPPSLSEPRFARAWEKWIRYRKEELRKPITQLSGDQALQELQGWGLERGLAAIEHTIARGWQGLREPEWPKGMNGYHAPTLSIREELRKAGL